MAEVTSLSASVADAWEATASVADLVAIARRCDERGYGFVGVCDHVAILDHGRLVLTGSVDEITRSRRECKLGLSRPLQDGELQRLGAIRGVRSIELTAVP